MIYAIGDIHGRLDCLERLLATIFAEADPGRTVLVFLGDYIDRGPQSRGVVEGLMLVQGLFETRLLRGNHDQSLLNFLSDPSAGPAWCDFGGRETLASYGVAAPALRGDAQGWVTASEDLAQSMPAEHLAFFRNLETSASYGDYFFCHAGARPGVPLGAQSDEDLMWIRDAFLRDARPFEQVIVHGHTPEPAVHIDRRRIGIDTGAYATGVLSAIRLEGAERTVRSS
ncbi:Bis(5'-nucleosyl)-tetraphosphatase, symmetrical [Brevundimonas subvibrioides]|uniref:metallophosphoesterase family protein n=1 Tax=Brevundimonas subvibrioides TaxID=74313 RepID=UPI0032D592FA